MCVEGSVHALRPLDIDVGPEVRAANGGYHKKVRMIIFAWSLQSVDDKIQGLKSGTLRRQARKALKYLLENTVDNEHHDYYNCHNAFLARHPDPTTQQAKRPSHFIEERSRNGPVATSVLAHQHVRIFRTAESPTLAAVASEEAAAAAAREGSAW